MNLKKKKEKRESKENVMSDNSSITNLHALTLEEESHVESNDMVE